jgi:hypothetical protein
MKHALALGCSHTAGVGVNLNECYVSLLSNHYQIPIKNLGTPGGNCSHIEKHLVQELKINSPDFVICQWPNVFRHTIWINGYAKNENIHHDGAVFKQLLALGEENFYNPWLQTIITCNLLCNLAKVPIVNIMIENINQQYHTVLNNQNIILHVDEKLPGLSWIVDNKGNDGMHHSANCHAQWAKRLIGLIDESTTT